MKKSIIISIKPKWVKKILNGKKTIEIRKSIPKCDLPIDVYIYCTKGKPYLYESFFEDWWWNDGVLEPLADRYGVRLSDFKLPEKFHDSESKGWNKLLNGFIVAKFTLNKVDKVLNNLFTFIIEGKETGYTNSIAKRSCLDFNDMHKYLYDKDGYAWHIDKLQIFSKPMDLSDFYRNVDDFVDARPCNCGKKCKYESYDLQEYQSICGIDYDGESCPFVKIQKAPQSWCYCYKEKE